jgi:2-amino-4-hydroxy-6-hydroxymethyldihydropteridine diphosphokinase
MILVYLALGSNLGNRAANLALAIDLLALEVRVTGVSRLYESEAADGTRQPRYFNAASRGETELGPAELLALCQRIEHAVGRRRAARWAPRVLDIDIALYGDLVIETPALTLPHPRLAERSFVVRPLLDLDPELRMPASGARLADIPVVGPQAVVIGEGEWWRA